MQNSPSGEPQPPRPPAALVYRANSPTRASDLFAFYRLFEAKSKLWLARLLAAHFSLTLSSRPAWAFDRAGRARSASSTGRTLIIIFRVWAGKRRRVGPPPPWNRRVGDTGPLVSRKSVNRSVICDLCAVSPSNSSELSGARPARFLSLALVGAIVAVAEASASQQPTRDRHTQANGPICQAVLQFGAFGSSAPVRSHSAVEGVLKDN